MFDESSRYADLPRGEIHAADGRRIVYIRRRLLPDPRSYQTGATRSVTDSDRLDLLAHQGLGEPTAFWMIADANGVMHPKELEETIGASRRIPIPQLRMGPHVHRGPS